MPRKAAKHRHSIGCWLRGKQPRQCAICDAEFAPRPHTTGLFCDECGAMKMPQSSDPPPLKMEIRTDKDTGLRCWFQWDSEPFTDENAKFCGIETAGCTLGWRAKKMLGIE